MIKSTSKRTTSDVGASNASSAKKMKKDMDITAECGICNQTLKSACMLICCHIFCRDCVKSLIENTDIKCPVCYCVTEVHSGGVDKFASGQFIVKLADLKKFKDGKAMNATKGHKTAESVKRESRTLPNTDVSLCQDHPDLKIEFYCRECNAVACITCNMDKHKQHKTFDISKWCLETRQVLDGHWEMLKKDIVDNEDGLKSVKASQRKFKTAANRIKGMIQKKYVSRNVLPKEQCESLTANLDSWTKRCEGDLENLKNDVERSLNAMKRFELYWSELKKYGSTCDIVQAGVGLHEIALDLMNEHVIQLDRIFHETRDDYYQIRYTPCYTELDGGRTVLGKMELFIDDEVIQGYDISVELDSRSTGDETDKKEEKKNQDS